jgi:hypothetical protein
LSGKWGLTTFFNKKVSVPLFPNTYYLSLITQLTDRLIAKKEVKKIMATELGEVTSYKRLYMQFRDSVGKTINLTLNNPKNVDDGDYVDFAAQDTAIEGVMDTIIAKNIFHNNGNDLTAKVNARILDYKSTDVMDV